MGRYAHSVRDEDASRAPQGMWGYPSTWRVLIFATPLMMPHPVIRRPARRRMPLEREDR